MNDKLLYSPNDSGTGHKNGHCVNDARSDDRQKRSFRNSARWIGQIAGNIRTGHNARARWEENGEHFEKRHYRKSGRRYEIFADRLQGIAGKSFTQLIDCWRYERADYIIDDGQRQRYQHDHLHFRFETNADDNDPQQHDDGHQRYKTYIPNRHFADQNYAVFLNKNGQFSKSTSIARRLRYLE